MYEHAASPPDAPGGARTLDSTADLRALKDLERAPCCLGTAHIGAGKILWQFW